MGLDTSWHVGERGAMTARGTATIVPGTPRWAVICAWGALASVVPSSVWRTLVGIGVPLGWSDEHLELEHIPGWGTLYVIALSVISIGAASLTLGLVQPWGERFPQWVPWLGGRRTATWFVVAAAALGAAAVTRFIVFSIANWSAVSGFDDRPGSAWAVLMAACYVPVILWPVLLVATLVAFVRRRAAS